MIGISTALGDHIDHRSRGLSEFSLKPCRQHLKLCNRLLIKLRRGAASDGIFVRLSVNKIIVIAAPLAQHRVRVIAAGISLPVDGYSRDKLYQIEVVSPVDGQLQD